MFLLKSILLLEFYVSKLQPPPRPDLPMSGDDGSVGSDHDASVVHGARGLVHLTGKEEARRGRGQTARRAIRVGYCDSMTS